MEDLNLEQFLVLLILVLWPLINFILSSLRRGAAKRPSDAVPTIPARKRMPDRSTSPPVGFQSDHAARAVVSSVPSPPLSPGPYTRKTILGGKRELRRAMITKTILGVCRANDPPP